MQNGMLQKNADRIIRAVLYEGYSLYPYRPSSIKNWQRWNFGVLYPASWTAANPGSDRSFFRMELLVCGPDDSDIDITIRFLHLATRVRNGQTWEDADERVVSQAKVWIGDVAKARLNRSFLFEGGQSGDRSQQPVQGEFDISAAPVAPGVFRLTLSVRNTTPSTTPTREESLLRSLASANAVLTIRRGSFVSQTDPPPELLELAAACENTGVWPVLLGEEPEHEAVLGTPVILPDYPQIAPESPGDLFDGTEIDEILTLRILTLTDLEKDEIRASDDKARQMLERAEALPPEHLMRLHGKIRTIEPESAWSAWDTMAPPNQEDTVRVNGSDLRKGDRVRLRPVKRADILDLAFAGKAAIIEAIERDMEDKVHLAVVLEDDPGRDLGEMRQAGHRFFFSLDEVEPIL